MKGETRLRRALHRLRAVVDPLPLQIHDADPPDAWARHLDDRLRLVEQKINDQNRVLVITAVSVVADIAYRLLT